MDSKPFCRGLTGLARNLLLLGQAGASGMSASIVVSMNQVVVVTAQVLATVAAELRSKFAASFLMFLQLFRTAESTNIADFYFLTGPQCWIQSDVQAGSRFHNTGMSSPCPGASTSLALGMRFRFRMRLRLRTGRSFLLRRLHRNRVLEGLQLVKFNTELTP